MMTDRAHETAACKTRGHVLRLVAAVVVAGSTVAVVSSSVAGAQTTKKTTTTKPTTTKKTTTTTTKKPDDDCGKIDTKKYPPTSRPCETESGDSEVGTPKNTIPSAVKGLSIEASPGPAVAIAGAPGYTG